MRVAFFFSLLVCLQTASNSFCNTHQNEKEVSFILLCDSLRTCSCIKCVSENVMVCPEFRET